MHRALRAGRHTVFDGSSPVRILVPTSRAQLSRGRPAHAHPRSEPSPCPPVCSLPQEHLSLLRADVEVETSYSHVPPPPPLAPAVAAVLAGLHTHRCARCSTAGDTILARWQVLSVRTLGSFILEHLQRANSLEKRCFLAPHAYGIPCLHPSQLADCWLAQMVRYAPAHGSHCPPCSPDLRVQPRGGGVAAVARPAVLPRHRVHAGGRRHTRAAQPGGGGGGVGAGAHGAVGRRGRTAPCCADGRTLGRAEGDEQSRTTWGLWASRGRASPTRKAISWSALWPAHVRLNRHVPF